MTWWTGRCWRSTPRRSWTPATDCATPPASTPCSSRGSEPHLWPRRTAHTVSTRRTRSNVCAAHPRCARSARTCRGPILVVCDGPELGPDPGQVAVLHVGAAEQLVGTVGPTPLLAVVVALQAVDQQREDDHHEH